MFVLWSVLVACELGGPATPARCAAMGGGSKRDACWATVAVELFQADPRAATARIEAEVEDPQIRDFIWLTITREVDPRTKRYCARIQSPTIAERCNVLVHRPHLHRALLGPK